MPGYGDWINYEAALSDVSDTNGASVFEGFVHDLAKDRLGEGLREVDLYFAGPPLMAGAVEQEIVRHYRVRLIKSFMIASANRIFEELL